MKNILFECGIHSCQDRSIEQIIDDVDINKDGRIDYQEFLRAMRKSEKTY